MFPDIHGTDATTRATHWVAPSVPQMAGSTLYVQTFLIDPLGTNPLPASTTNVGAVMFQ